MRNNSRCWKEIFWLMKVLLRCWPALFDIIFCGNMVYSFINLISPYALRFKPPKVCFGRLVILLCKRWQSWVNGYDYVDQIREM